MIVWNPRDSRAVRPPLDEELHEWQIHNKRRSHFNASRTFEGKEYHLKWFFNRLFSGNPALREFENAKQVKKLGILSVDVVGWGRHSRGTFFVMEGSPGLPIYKQPSLPELKLFCEMARELGRIVAVLHNADLCHRDLYVDHVLIDDATLRLIDVGRVMKFRRRRWIVKDLAGLLFSAWRENIPPGVSRAFLESYLKKSRRPWNRKKLIAALQKKAQVYWHHNRRDRKGPDGESDSV